MGEVCVGGGGKTIGTTATAPHFPKKNSTTNKQ